MGVIPSSSQIYEFQKLKKKIKKQIESNYSSYNFSSKQDVEKWKNKVIEIIETNLDEKFLKISQEKIVKSQEKIVKNNNNVSKKSNPIDVFTSEEIQMKNKQITTELEKISYDYDNDNDENENFSIAHFLLEVANISRNAFNISNEYLKENYKEFEKEQKEPPIISSIEQFKKNFSIWTKKNNILENLSNNLKKNNYNYNIIDEEIDKKKKKYFNKLYNDLLILYFQCAITFPSIEIDFNSQNNFDSSKMIDYLNKGSKNKKVNFVFFPSLYSNGKYLENGKKWVFTYFDDYKKKTFYFTKPNLIHINKENIFHIPHLSEKLELNLEQKTFLIPRLNYKISKEINQKYVFSLQNRKTKKIEKKECLNSKISLSNYEFIKCDFYIQDELILTSNKIN